MKHNMRPNHPQSLTTKSLMAVMAEVVVTTSNSSNTEMTKTHTSKTTVTQTPTITTTWVLRLETTTISREELHIRKVV